MGAETSAPVQSAPAAAPADKEAAEAALKERVALAEQHICKPRADGRFECSCGMVVPTKHYHNLHIEVHGAKMKPTDPTGWPARHFETVPNGLKIQRGVVAKGDFDNAVFLTIKLADGFDDAAVKQAVSEAQSKLLDDVAGTFGGREEVRIVSVIGVSPDLWKRWDPIPPKELTNFNDKICPATGEPIFPSTAHDEDLLLFVKCPRKDVCYQVAKEFRKRLGKNLKSYKETYAFRYGHGTLFGVGYAKDLTGFIDGTRNPDHLLRAVIDETIIFPDDEDEERHVGGTYMYAGRFVHDLPKFESLTLDQKNQIIGRDFSKVEPHHGYDNRPENPHLEESKTHHGAHILRGFASMYRQAMPYKNPDEEGLFFICFARSMHELDASINRMSGAYSDDGSPDNLFQITKSVTNNYFYVPSLPELEKLKTPEALGVAKDALSSKIDDEKVEDSKVKIFFEYWYLSLS